MRVIRSMVLLYLGLFFMFFVRIHNADAAVSLFPQADKYYTGGMTHSVASADLNADQILDLVAVNCEDSTISVLIGNGDGTFGPEMTHYEVGLWPKNISIGDMDGDGHQDLVVVNYLGLYSLSILWGKSDGTFLDAQKIRVRNSCYSSAIGDFNEDGHMDIAVASWYDGGSLNILWGKGNRSFTLETGIFEGNNQLVGWVTSGHLNPDVDAFLDLVITFHKSENDGEEEEIKKGAIVLFYGKGDGRFDQVEYEVGRNPTAVVIADLNTDNTPDIVVTNEYDGNVSVFLGQGNNLFGPVRNYMAGTEQLFISPVSVTTADINIDGHLDIIVANRDGRTINGLFGTGTGSFAPGVSVTKGPNEVSFTDGLLVFVISRDFNSDGAMDLAAASFFPEGTGETGAFFDGYISVFLNAMGCADGDCPCKDEDNDGYGTEVSANCTYLELDCDDTNANVNPGMTEIPSNGIDDDCAMSTPGWDAPASQVGIRDRVSSISVNTLAMILTPLGFLVIWIRRRQRK